MPPHQTGPLVQALEGDADRNPGQMWLASRGSVYSPNQMLAVSMASSLGSWQQKGLVFIALKLGELIRAKGSVLASGQWAESFRAPDKIAAETGIAASPCKDIVGQTHDREDIDKVSPGEENYGNGG